MVGYTSGDLILFDLTHTHTHTYTHAHKRRYTSGDLIRRNEREGRRGRETDHIHTKRERERERARAHERASERARQTYRHRQRKIDTPIAIQAASARHLLLLLLRVINHEYFMLSCSLQGCHRFLLHLLLPVHPSPPSYLHLFPSLLQYLGVFLLSIATELRDAVIIFSHQLLLLLLLHHHLLLLLLYFVFD